MNDKAGVLTSQEVRALEEMLVAVDDSTSNQIVIVLLQTLEGYPIEEYATRLFREWGIGNKKQTTACLSWQPSMIEKSELK